MGLISGLLLLPLAPVQGVCWVADVVLDAAEREAYDPAVVRAQLAALNRALDEGEIDVERFERAEEQLLDLLDHQVSHSGARHGGGTR